MLLPTTKLYKHQTEAKAFLLQRDNAACFAECGVGKTLILLSTFADLRKKDPTLKMIVFAPISLLETAWKEDIQKFTAFTSCNLYNLTAKKKTPDVDIYIINYESIRSKVKSLRIKEVCEKYLIMGVLDESAKIRQPRTQLFKELIKYKEYFKNRFILSGCPMPNSEMEIWTQMFFLSDEILPKNFYAFRNIFFHMARGMQKMSCSYNTGEAFKKGWKYAITKKKKDELMEAVHQVSFFAKRNECLDLPDRVTEIRKVKMCADQKTMYNSMKKTLVAEIADDKFIIAPIALTKLQKLSQIVNGWIYDEQKHAHLFTSNPKLKELLSTLEEIDEQVIIWAVYRKDIELIKEALGEKACVSYGGTSQVDRDKNIKAFKAGKYQYIIANPCTMAHGITLTNCSAMIFYGLDYSYENLHQAQARIYRIGQSRKCLYIYLQMANSIDETIYAVLQRKGSVLEALKEVLR